MESLAPWAQFIRELGFPIFVAFYLLVRIERVIRDQELSNHQLREAIHKLMAELEKRK